MTASETCIGDTYVLNSTRMRKSNYSSVLTATSARYFQHFHSARTATDEAMRIQLSFKAS